MGSSFDFDSLIRKIREIRVHSRGKTFRQLEEEIDSLRRQYKQIRDATARQYVRRVLSHELIMFALEKSQPPIVVDRLYRRSVRYGSLERQGQLSVALSYAYYCGEKGSPKKGLNVLEKLKRALCDRNEFSPDILANFLEPIERCRRRLTGVEQS